MMSTSSDIAHFKAGDVVWIPWRRHGYRIATIVSLTSRGAHVDVPAPPVEGKTSGGGSNRKSSMGGTKIIPLNQIKIYDSTVEEVGGHSDVTMMTHIDEANILHNMEVRYGRDLVYTYVGSVLLAVNPYKRLGGEERMSEYWEKPPHTRPPHPYAIAEAAYRNFISTQQSQAILISGESGAGKTETAKIVASYLARKQTSGWTEDTPQVHSITGQVQHTVTELYDKVLRANPILEAFGNARTVRNNNSSRFGKYSSLWYTKGGRLVCASLTPFLLESARVTSHATGERNYHVFYQLLAGCTEEQQEMLRLRGDDGRDYALTNQGGDSVVSNEQRDHDAAKFAELCESLTAVGLTKEDQNDIFSIVSALLLLGGVEFEEDKEEDEEEGSPEDGHEPSQAEPEPPSQGGMDTTSNLVANDFLLLDDAASLLGLDTMLLNKTLLYRRMKLNNAASSYQVARTPEQVTQSLNTLIRIIYARLFERIVKKVNMLMGYNDGSNDMERLYNHIGILDIYGFESLEKNSYEQLLINLTNERLQQFFVSKVLDREQQAYEAEGIQWESVPLPDATPTVRVIHGALSILDDCCLRASRGMPEDDDKYVGEVQQRFFDGSAGCKLKPPKPQRAPPNRGFRKGMKIERAKITSGFIIDHYAGEVTYTVSGWMEKNNGRMVPEMESLILGSSNAWARELGDQEGCSMQCEKFKSVRKHFTDELEKMLKMLDKTGLHYIRCFNPNSQQMPDHFDRRYVLSQVIQCGTVELVNMMHYGYPNRLPIKDLVNRYRHMMPKRFHAMDDRSFILALLHGLGMPSTEFSVGLTRVFLRARQLEFLEKLKGSGEAQVDVNIIKEVLARVARQRFKSAIHVVIICQRLPKILKASKRLRTLAILADKIWLVYRIKRATCRLLAAARKVIDERNKENQRLEEMRIQAALKMQEEEEAARKEEERLKKVEEESRRKLEERRKREEEVAAARQRSEKRKLESGDGGSSMKDGRFVSPSPVLPSRKLQFEGKGPVSSPCDLSFKSPANGGSVERQSIYHSVINQSPGGTPDWMKVGEMARHERRHIGSALDASALCDDLYNDRSQPPFCPIPRVFLTINNFVEGKRMSEKKWGVGGSSVVGAVYYYCMDLEGRQVRSNGVVETALFFDAERRRLVAADLPVCGTGSRREVPLMASRAYVVDPINSTVVGEGEAADELVEAICQHPNKLDIFATTNGKDVVVWCWHGDQPGGWAGGLVDMNTILEAKCVISDMLGGAAACIRLMTFLPHGNRVLLVSVVEVRNSIGEGGALRHIIRLDEVLPQRSAQQGNHYRTRRHHDSLELETPAVRVAVAATVGMEEFVMNSGDDSGEGRSVDVKESLVNPFRVLTAGLSGRTVLIGGRNVLQLFEVVEQSMGDGGSENKKEERRIRLVADCVRDFDDFEDIDVTDCLPILPEQEGRSMRRSQEGLMMIDRYLVTSSSGQVVSLVVSSQRHRGASRSSSGVKESLLLDVSKSSIVVTATEAATSHVRSIVCPWKETRRLTPTGSRPSKRATGPGLHPPREREGDNEAMKAARRRTDRQAAVFYMLCNAGVVRQYNELSQERKWKLSGEEWVFGPSSSSNTRLESCEFECAEFSRVDRHRMVLVDTATKNLLVSTLDADAPPHVVHLPR